MKKHVNFLLIFTIVSLATDVFSQDCKPDGALQKIQQLEELTPPSGWEAVLCWLQAVTINKNQVNEEATIVIDYMKMYEVNVKTNNVNLIYEENYNYDEDNLQEYEGGLYEREPSWYPPGDKHSEMYNSQIKNGYLYIDVSQTPKKIAHWWTERQYCKANNYYYLEVKVKIIGKAVLQIGADWWRTIDAMPTVYGENNLQAWNSDWFCDTGGKFITITVPFIE